MDGVNERRATRASKRRRISPPTQQASAQPTRSNSPDELASAPQTPRAISRRGSTHSQSVPPEKPAQAPPQTSGLRRPSFSPVSGSSSPDELDHTANEEFHTFYRANPSYRPASFSNRDGVAFQQGDTRPPSPPTPAYSRISTPARSPSLQLAEPRRELKDPVFRPYRCRSVLRGNKKGVSMVKFSRDGRFVASSGEFLRTNLRTKNSFMRPESIEWMGWMSE